MIRIPENHLAKAIAKTFKDILSTKHLYQSIDVPKDFVEKVAKESELPNAIHVQLAIKTATCCWNLLAGPKHSHVSRIGTEVELPNIQTFCHECRVRKPFSAFEAHSRDSGYPSETWESATTEQSFHLGFQCQACQSASVDFLVTRRVMKLTISGRWPIEEVETPNYIPTIVRKHYRNALIANHAGQTLAALFLLRTVIEQFWVSLGLRNGEDRTTGDALGTRYKMTLPDGFKSQFPSLSDIYESISTALHTVNSDADIFETSMGRVNEHFDARRLFKLDVPPHTARETPQR
jgi:hypothetical protein